MIQSIAYALRAALIADGTISAAVGARCYLTRAPESASLPYGLLNYVGGGSTNDTPRDAFDQLWQVQFISDDAAQAQDLSDRARDLLHNASITLESPWKLIDLQHEDPFFFVEDVDRRQYLHAGGTYRVRGSK